MTARPTVHLATCAKLPSGDGDETGLPRALSERDCAVRWIVWDDPSNPVAAADLVVLRATWDYPERRAEFLAWCESVPRLCNAAGVVRWNTDKAYLLDLEAAGVPVVPTEVVPPGATPRWPDTEFVVKPSVGAGSRGARRFPSGGYDAASEHLNTVHSRGVAALVQPYQPSVDTDGETAVVFFGGAYSHAFGKGPMLTRAAATTGADGSGLFLAEKLATAEPDGDVRLLAEDTLDATSGILGVSRSELLYARVDVVRDGCGRPVVLEVELSEPSLGLRQAGPEATARFASAIAARLGG
ncbi:hypothetical protein [Haloechinothrix sp. LS1_15]|uniref:ATP-grasp domain-containing protein n=1 Tax=Haloechinothrix sp. LS1_15 TaxID=2652248 RepID=UPI00294495C4|nr:hypothetical protein [Haloechinothrix sp. LS1_15]MDV6013221.1 hypothetical protein [Haloechinothrix sp. LS1_15]